MLLCERRALSQKASGYRWRIRWGWSQTVLFLYIDPVAEVIVVLSFALRIEDARLRRAKAAREAYAQTVGEDGFRVLDAVDAPDAPEAVRTLPSIAILRRPWQRHYTRTEPTSPTTRKRPGLRVRFKAHRELPRAAEGLESPYDPEARSRHKRAP
jgi:transposase